MKKRKKSIGLEVRKLNNMFMRRMESVASNYGDDAITVVHGWILGYLFHRKDTDTFQKDIEKELSLSRSSVTCILKILEEKGCIRRESVDFDARLKKIVLLPRGEEIHNKSIRDVLEIEDMLCEDISDEDLEVFYRVIDKAKSNLLK